MHVPIFNHNWAFRLKLFLLDGYLLLSSAMLCNNAMQVFGTNPFCVSAPAAQASDRYLLDMSTSAVAVGKIEMQLRKGEPLPSRGWALGRDDQVGIG